MTKSGFNRGLSAATLPAVKAFLETEIGHYLKNDNNFQICIRDEYINVYYNGCSILKYTPITDKYEIHYKYTKEPKSKLYIELKRNGNDLVVNNFSLNDLLKKPETYIGPYFCGEKKYLAQYLKSDQAPAIIDLEVAYTCRASIAKKRDFVAKRIDLAVIENSKLRLIEVKIDTDSRLRAEKDGDQEILDQMKSYREFIKAETKNIITSYKTIAQNILDLDLIHQMGGTPKFTIDNLSAFIANNDCFDPDPVLLVAETGKSKIGRNGVDHWNRLLSQFEKLGFQPPRTWSYCPFCHGHKDFELVWHELADAFVCLGCRHEIDCGLDFDDQPTADNYNCYDTIERLLQRLGISYADLQQRHRKLEEK